MGLLSRALRPGPMIIIGLLSHALRPGPPVPICPRATWALDKYLYPFSEHKKYCFQEL